MTDRPAVLLLATPSSYRLAAFVRAAGNLDLEVIRGIDTPGSPASRSPDTIHLDFTFARAAVSRLVGFVRTRPNTTVLAIDDAAVEIAASVNHRLRRSHNLPGADVASRDKAVMRQRFHDADLPTPECRPLDVVRRRIRA